MLYYRRYYFDKTKNKKLNINKNLIGNQNDMLSIFKFIANKNNINTKQQYFCKGPIKHIKYQNNNKQMVKCGQQHILNHYDSNNPNYFEVCAIKDIINIQ